MEHHALRNDPYRLSALVQTPAQVDFLHVGEEILVETASGEIFLRAHRQRGTCSPENVGDVVVLSVVGLHGVEYSSAAERISMLVDESPRRTSIFKFRVVGGIAA